ncbi:MAG: hypothetical protein LUD22_03080 [Coprobacillus sp.]|nr:hypothetical protein [Coprobacillus sp.]
MSKGKDLVLNNHDKKFITNKASFIVVVISFALSIIDMGLISSCDYSTSAIIEAVVAFLLEGVCSLVFLVGIVTCSIYVAKKKIGITMLITDIILFLVWILTTVVILISIIYIIGGPGSDDPENQYYKNIDNYHFNVVYFEHYSATFDIRTSATTISYDYYFPYINFVGNLIVSAVIIPLYVKEYAKHKSEHQIE